MSKFEKYKTGTIVIEIQSLIPEKFINLLWKNDVNITNIIRKDITTMSMEIHLKDYGKIEGIAKRTKTKVKIVGRKGITFFLIKIKKRVALIGGIIIFVGLLYYLSTFIWGIDIVTENNLSPYEIRQQLMSYGVKPGVNKKDLNLVQLQEKMIKNNENIMWIRVLEEGAKLKVNVIERQTPPNIVDDNSNCNLIAKKDGQVIRAFTSAGTAAVKAGDIVKKGQILVKGEQGKEGSTYLVHAKGDVIARTFYEEIKEVPMKEVKRTKTENKVESFYVVFRGKKFYIKNSLNKFQNYDKIVDDKGFVKKETYYEVKEESLALDSKKVVEDTVAELYSKITANLDKSVKIIDKIVDPPQVVGDNYKIRIVIIAEENIALPQKIE